MRFSLSVRLRQLASIACAAALLVGCSGNASSGSSSLPSASGSNGVARPQHVRHPRRGTLTITVRVPHHRHRRPDYISSKTKGMTLALTGPMSLVETVGLTPASPGCTRTNDATTCTVSVNLRAGKYTATIDAYDNVSCAGSSCIIPAGAQLLSSALNAPFTIKSGKANSVGVTLGGIIASLSVSGLPAATIGTALSAKPFSVVARDRDDQIIVGKYYNPVLVTNSDESGTVTIATSGSDNPPTAELLRSSDTATLTYSGDALLSATISAKVSGAITAIAGFAPAPVLTSISTSSGLIGTGVSETFNGHFVSGATTVSAGSGVTVSNVVATASTITATLFIDPSAATGPRDVTANTVAATSAPKTFTISNTGADVVTLNTDSNPGSGGTSGDLRYVMLNASAGDTIVFDTQSMCGAAQCTITLGGPLPPLVQNQTIEGGSLGRVTIDGASAYRAFFADTGTVTIANLKIQNAKAQGGNGATGGYAGGGGAGLGAGLFVNNASANVTVTNDNFFDDVAVGGNGGNCDGPQSGSGGGGLGGSGGGGGASGGGGGGGVLGGGTSQGDTNAGSGGAGGGGGGGGGFADPIPTAGPGSGASGYATNAGGTDGTSDGGSGGFGGGGGGGGASGNGGAGGFGGGGGGGNGSGGAGANGGPGGGGGAGSGAGGSLGSVSGGNAATSGGGGGAAAGPAIFVNAGTLTTNNSSENGSDATAGSGGTQCGAGATSGSADATAVFNYAGTVNGDATTGPIAGALTSSAAPRRRAKRKNGWLR